MLPFSMSDEQYLLTKTSTLKFQHDNVWVSVTFSSWALFKYDSQTNSRERSSQREQASILTRHIGGECFRDLNWEPKLGDDPKGRFDSMCCQFLAEW